MGAQRKNIWVCDIDGVVYEGRATLMDRWKAVYAQKTDKRMLADVIGGADIFLGLSAPNVLKPDMVKQMADKPLVMALANPNPEIMPDEARKARPDAMICTGRSRLSQPGQQCPVLSLHLPRRARRRRHRDQRGNEEGRGRCDRAARARSAGGRGRAGFRQRRGARVRPGLADSEPVRSAADPAHCAGGGEGGDGFRRRDASDQEFRGLSRPAGALRVPLRPCHEAGVRQGEDPAGSRDLRRRRGRARPACDAGGAGGEAGAADPGRTSLGGRSADQAVRPRHQGRPGFRSRSIPRTIRAIAPMSSPTSTSPAGTASRPMPRARWCAPTPP